MNTGENTSVDPHPTKLDRHLVKLGFVIVLSSMMSVIDSTTVNVATRTIGRDFDTSISTAQWVLTGYLLAFAAIVPATGWASDRFSARRVWLGAVLVFMICSALSGFAWSIGSLVLFRILQGLASGMIQPVGQAIIAQAAGPRRMGRALGMVFVPVTFATVMGPVVGGLIVSTAGWRWIFFISLPVGALALLVGWRLFPRTAPQPHQRLDLRGLLLLSFGVAIFVYGISAAAGQGGISSARFLVGVTTGAVLVILYMVHAYYRKELALIDVSLLRERNFTAVAVTSLVIGAALYGVLVLQPLYWQVVRGESPLVGGLLLTPQAIGVILALPLAARVTDRAGAHVVVPVGITVALLGTLAFTQVGAYTPYAVVAGALLVVGLGQGAIATPLVTAVYVTLSRDAIPRATSALQVLRRMGGSIGTATLAIVLDHAIRAEAPQLGGSALGTLPSTTRAQVAPALADAFTAAYWVAFILTAVALLPTFWLFRTARRQKESQRAGEAEVVVSRAD